MRERAPGSAGGRVPDSLLPSSPPRAPPPLPAPAAASAPQSTEPPRPRGREHRPGCRCSQSPGRALTSCRRGGSPEPVRSPAAAAGSSSFWSHEGLRASGRTSPSLPARGESELRPERAWGAPAVKASRRPIRHGRRRRRERQEKVSPCPPPAASAAGAPARRRPASRAGLGVRGAAFLFLLFLPSPPLAPPTSRAGLPLCPRRHLGEGGGRRTKVLPGVGGWAQLARPSRPPGPRAALLARLKEPAGPGPLSGGLTAPRPVAAVCPRASAPSRPRSSLFPLKTRPRVDPARGARLPSEGRAGSGALRPGCPRRRGRCLCAGGICRGGRGR